MTFTIETQTGILIKKAARLFEQLANRDLEAIGVTYAQTTVLIRLWAREGQNQMELAKSSGLKQPTIVRLLDRMERDLLITRKQNSNDRRVFNFYLTKIGKLACQKLEGYADAMNQKATESLSENQVVKLNTLIMRVILNLEKKLRTD